MLVLALEATAVVVGEGCAVVELEGALFVDEPEVISVNVDPGAEAENSKTLRARWGPYPVE